MVERSDIEAKAREIQQLVGETKEAAQDSAVKVAVGVGVVILLTFLLGRRRGKQSKAVVEVYRV